MQLVGEAFEGLVLELEETLQALQSGSRTTPRVLLLEAEAGSGKSRVVREFYERLRANQPVTQDGAGYWPPLPDSDTWDDRAREILATRKVIGPSTSTFVRPPGALPSFFWLSVQCDQAPDGSLTPAIETMWPSLRAHARFVAASWRLSSSADKKLRRWIQDQIKDETAALGQEASLEALSRILSSFDIAMPGVGWLIGKGMQAGLAIRDRRRFNTVVESGGQLDAGIVPAEELALQLLRMTNPRLPLILVVEDAHLMDQSLADVLEVLAKPEAGLPVLVVATAWPEGRGRPIYKDWRDRLLDDSGGSPLARLNGGGPGRTFPSLDESARIDMVLAHGPGTGLETAGLMARKWPLPYTLLLALTSNRLKEYLEDGSFVIDPAELESMPSDISGLSKQRWRELPEEIKQALMLAAGALPEPTDGGSVTQYIIDVVAAAASNAGLLDDTAFVGRALGASVDPFEWSRLEDRSLDLVAFREWTLERIAREAFEDRGFRKRDQFTTAVMDELARRINELRDAGVLLGQGAAAALPLSRWLLAIDPSRSDAAGTTAALTIANAVSETMPFDAIRLITEHGRTHALAPESPESIAAQLLLANAQRDARLYAASVQTLRRLYGELGGSGHRDDLTLLEVGNELAGSLAYLGDYQGALTLFGDLLSAHAEILGPDHPDTLTIRHNLAWTLAEAGRHAEAIIVYRDLLTDRIGILGIDHPFTMGTRSGLAWAYAASGQVPDAMHEFDALLETRIRVLGPTHPETLETKFEMAEVMTHSGKAEEAIRLYEELIDQQTTAIGARHPDTLWTMYSLGSCRLETGDHVAALSLYETVLQAREETLGEEHPDSLNTRTGILIALDQAGQSLEALVVCDDLLRRQEAALGRDHLHVVATRENRAYLLGRLDRHDEAIDELETACDISTREFGSNHPVSLRVRRDLADTLVEAHQPGRARPIYESLLEDLEQLHGPDNHSCTDVRDALGALPK